MVAIGATEYQMEHMVVVHWTQMDFDVLYETDCVVFAHGVHWLLGST